MEYRRLGQHGLKVSELSLGAWVTFGGQVGEDVSRECILAAYEAGVNYFDNADVYAGGNAEIVMGNIIKDLKRTDLVISSKVFWPSGEGPNDRGLSRKHIMESLHTSLKRLGTDYVDLYFCHRYDPEVPVEEVVRAANLVSIHRPSSSLNTICFSAILSKRSWLKPPSNTVWGW